MNNNNEFFNHDFDKDETAFDMIIKLANEAKQNIKTMKEIQLEVRKSEQKVVKVGDFVVKFYNEYREHDALTLAQVKELKKAQHEKTSEITKILCPRLGESRKRGEQYLVEWNKVNKGLWSIFKTNVNGVSIPYDRTPKNKFKQSLEYVKNLTVADYLAYRDERWEDIRNFDFVEPLEDDLMTIEKVLNDKNDDDNDDGSPTPMLMH